MSSFCAKRWTLKKLVPCVASKIKLHRICNIHGSPLRRVPQHPFQTWSEYEIAVYRIALQHLRAPQRCTRGGAHCNDNHLTHVSPLVLCWFKVLCRYEGAWYTLWVHACTFIRMYMWTKKTYLFMSVPQALPRAMTCANMLQLPRYSKRDRHSNSRSLARSQSHQHLGKTLRL